MVKRNQEKGWDPGSGSENNEVTSEGPEELNPSAGLSTKQPALAKAFRSEWERNLETEVAVNGRGKNWKESRCLMGKISSFLDV